MKPSLHSFTPAGVIVSTAKPEPVQFGSLNIGDTFDFIGGEYVSFFNRCTKVSPLGYSWVGIGGKLLKSKVGSRKCPVYHVEPRGEA